MRSFFTFTLCASAGSSCFAATAASFSCAFRLVSSVCAFWSSFLASAASLLLQLVALPFIDQLEPPDEALLVLFELPDLEVSLSLSCLSCSSGSGSLFDLDLELLLRGASLRLVCLFLFGQLCLEAVELGLHLLQLLLGDFRPIPLLLELVALLFIGQLEPLNEALVLCLRQVRIIMYVTSPCTRRRSRAGQANL